MIIIIRFKKGEKMNKLLNMTQNEIVEFLKNKAINVKNLQEDKKLRTILHQKGFKWGSGDNLLDLIHYYEYKEKTCYSIKSKVVRYADIDACKEHGYTIISFSDLDDSLTEQQKTFISWNVANPKKYDTEEKWLEAYENYILSACLSNEYSFNYFEEKRDKKHYSDMTSARHFRKMIESIKRNDSIDFIFVTNGISTDENEIREYLRKRKNQALKKLKSYNEDLRRFKRNHQLYNDNGEIKEIKIVGGEE